MRGLDTNVLVRYITRDDPVRFALASELIEQSEAMGQRLYVNTVVLSELAWVLSGSRYRFPRSLIAETFEKLLAIPLFEIEDRDEVLVAVAEYRSGRGDFADYLIGRKNLAAGCHDTVTFDTHLGEGQAFEVWGAP